ncbi:hypothetical protein ACQKE5_08770 [Paenisporosarcina sp. NPDC076898]|uniref:hypothetical protein n=1 Tax=Paenisporosarcina sp. NPDC076898 TaxID=3390603 RepID=UPI003D07DF13
MNDYFSDVMSIYSDVDFIFSHVNEIFSDVKFYGTFFNKAQLNEIVDLRSMRTLSAGGPLASSFAMLIVGSSLDTLIPLESPDSTTIIIVNREMT